MTCGVGRSRGTRSQGLRTGRLTRGAPSPSHRSATKQSPRASGSGRAQGQERSEKRPSILYPQGQAATQGPPWVAVVPEAHGPEEGRWPAPAPSGHAAHPRREDRKREALGVLGGSRAHLPGRAPACSHASSWPAIPARERGDVYEAQQKAKICPRVQSKHQKQTGRDLKATVMNTFRAVMVTQTACRDRRAMKAARRKA